MEFVINSAIFCKFIKRLSGSVSNQDNKLLFLLEKGQLQIYYKFSIDRTEASCIFYDSLPLIAGDDGEHCTVLAKDFIDLKIPESTKEDKFPKCSDIKFKISDNILEMTYDILWAAGVEPTKITLHHTTVENLQINLFNKINCEYNNYIDLDSASLLTALNYCNFFKADATSTILNGSLLEIIDSNILYFVSTDSNIAVRYKLDLGGNSSIKNLRVVLSHSILKFLRNFVQDLEVVRFYFDKSLLLVDAGSRRVCLPIVSAAGYIIENVEEFFNIHGNRIALLDLKPVQSIVSSLSNKVQDIYKTVNLKFNDKLDVIADKNSSNNIPATVYDKANIFINGDFLSTVLGRLLLQYENVYLYFEESNSRIALVSEDQTVIFLIQGQTA